MSEGLRDLAVLPRHSSKIMRLGDWLRRVLGVDRAIAFTVLARSWGSAAGLVTVALIARFLSPAEQGYYYTFGSLVALQIVFELGFSFVILQMASHECARLCINNEQKITGDPVAHARLASALQKAVRWYSAAAMLMAVTVMPAGFYFFSTHQHPGQIVLWRLPWCSAALIAVLNFQLDPLLSFLEGCGYVPEIARLRLGQSVLGSVLAWAVLSNRHGLYAPSMMLLGMAAGSLVFLAGKRKLLYGLLKYSTGQDRIHWRKEVWPFQWRIAVSWLCGYFVFWIFNPVLFAFRGPVEAGQMGMSLSLANAIQALAVSWVSTKSAPFGTLIAQKEYRTLDQKFFQALKQAAAVAVMGALTAWIGCAFLNLRHVRFAERLLTPLSIGMLMVIMIVNVIVFSQAYYLRAHKQEVFFVNSVVGAIVTILCTFIFGRYYGANGIVVSCFVGSFLGLAWATYKFQKYRRLWHSS